MADELDRALRQRDLALMAEPRSRGVAPRKPGILDIGNGVTERLAFLNQTFNPVEGIGSAMRAGSRMLAPDQSYWDRISALGEMVSGVASIAAPIAAAKAIGVPAASAMMEGLLGFSPARQAAGDMATQFARSESGALPGGGPGRPPLTFDEVARAMQEEQPVNLGQFRQERARQDLISKVKGAIEDVSSGAYQARLDENAFELHKSGNLPLRVGTRVSPPSTYEMGSDLRVSGYWVDQQNPNIFGYKLQNEAGQEFTEFVSNPRLGLVPTAADRFGGGFKAFAGPNADQRLGFKAPETPTAAARPSSSPEIDAEFEALFGAGTERAPLDVSRRDASNIFGAGSERVRYTDPQSGGTIEVVVRPDGSASVLELEVPEASRGQGIGQTLQERVMQDFPMMGGQVSSKAAATTAYRLGRRPPGKPDATLEEVFADIDEMSSVNMVSPAMQERLAPAVPTRSSVQDIEGTLQAKYPDVKLRISGSPERGYTLNKIDVPKGKRESGIGTAVMNDLVNLADQQGAVLKLSPSGDFGGSVPRLKDFYARFGFVQNKGRNADYAISESMYRNPASVVGPQ